MKTTDEIKKGLECCKDYQSCTECGEPKCPYNDIRECVDTLLDDALAYIQQLEAKVEELERVRADLTATNMKLRDAVFKQELHMRRLEEERSEFESRVPRWVSVEDKKPPRHMGEYLCWCALDDDPEHKWDWAMVLRWHAIEGNGIVDRPHFTDEGVNGMYVTHWMPLPEPPKEE